LAALAREGVNLLAFSAVPFAANLTQLTLYPEESGSLTRAARNAGMTLDGPHHALLVQGDDELGALAGIHERLYRADVNVYAARQVRRLFPAIEIVTSGSVWWVYCLDDLSRAIHPRQLPVRRSSIREEQEVAAVRQEGRDTVVCRPVGQIGRGHRLAAIRWHAVQRTAISRKKPPVIRPSPRRLNSVAPGVRQPWVPRRDLAGC
jgi:hypothetical protein